MEWNRAPPKRPTHYVHHWYDKLEEKKNNTWSWAKVVHVVKNKIGFLCHAICKNQFRMD